MMKVRMYMGVWSTTHATLSYVMNGSRYRLSVEVLPRPRPNMMNVMKISKPDTHAGNEYVGRASGFTNQQHSADLCVFSSCCV